MQSRQFREIPGMPSRPCLPVVIEAGYTLADDARSATLAIAGNNAHAMHLTVVHESAVVTKHELRGDEHCERLCIRTGEGIIILARFYGEIVACGFYQVNLGLYGSISSVMLQVSASNLDVVQCDMAMIDRAFARALAGVTR